MENMFFEVLKSNGLTAALVVFFVWLGWKREQQLTTRLNQLEDWIHDRFSEIISGNTARMSALESASEDLETVIYKAPCGEWARRLRDKEQER